MTSPAFQFYAAEFLADENVVLMTNQEVGCYIKLICYCWREGTIPSDIDKLARLCGEDSSAMAQLWLSLCAAFTVAIDQPSRLLHPRLEKERIKQAEFSKERAESGSRGANARWHKGLRKDSSAIAQPLAEPLANHGSSSSSSSSSKPPKGRLQEPTEDQQKLAVELSVDCDGEFAKFKDYCGANDRRYANEAKAFSLWLRNAVKFQRQPSQPRGVPSGRDAARRATIEGLTGGAGIGAGIRVVNEND